MTSSSEPLRDRLRSAQETYGLSSNQMAKELRITPEWLSKILNGKAKGSDDIGLRLDDFLRRRGAEPSSTERELSSYVGEDDGGLESEIRRDMETLLWAAKRDPERLGWIIGQMREHLAVPRHWRTNEELNQRARELARQSREARDREERARHLPGPRTAKSA